MRVVGAVVAEPGRATAYYTSKGDVPLRPNQTLAFSPDRGYYAREHGRQDDRTPARARELAGESSRPPLKVLSPRDYTTPHRQAEQEAVELIDAQARKSNPGVRVIVREKVPLGKLPEHAIVIEPEYVIERASKRYRGKRLPEPPTVVYSGKADVVEFIPQRHLVLIWEVKRSTVGGSEEAAVRRAIGDAEHYVVRFDVSTDATAKGYHAALGTRFRGEGAVHHTRFVELGAVLYGPKDDKRKRPVRDPHTVPSDAPSLAAAYLALLAALAAAGLGGRGQGGRGPLPRPVPAHARPAFGRPFNGRPLFGWAAEWSLP